MKKILCLLLLLLLALPVAGCGGDEVEQSRELPFTDITAEKHDWQAETCRLIYTSDTGAVRGRVRNTSAWPNGGLTLYVRFLDEAGEVLVTGQSTTVFETAVEPNGTGGYLVNIKGFYDYDRIASVTIEFGK